MPAGRPTDYREEYGEALIEHCKDGASITSFAAAIDVDRKTLNNWAGEHPEFFLALQRAKAKIAAWWDKQGRDVAENGGQGGRATMVIFGLKNHDSDDFRDKTEHEHTGELTITRVNYGK